MSQKNRIWIGGVVVLAVIVIALLPSDNSSELQSGPTEGPSNEEAILDNNTSESMSETNEPTIEECVQVVQNYLETVKNNPIDESQVVESGNTVVVDYIGRLEDGTVFDTSLEEIAKGCGVYNPERDYTSGLDFEVGAGEVIEGFQQGVLGMHPGETKTVEIPAAQAYGDGKITLGIADLGPHPEGGEYTVGEQFGTPGGMIEILAIDGDSVTISDPNPMAGKDLIFDISVREIR